MPCWHASFLLPGLNCHVTSHPGDTVPAIRGPQLQLGKATVLGNSRWLPDLDTFLKRLAASSGLPVLVHSTLHRVGPWPGPLPSSVLTASQAPAFAGSIIHVARLGRMTLSRQPPSSNSQAGGGVGSSWTLKGRAKQAWLSAGLFPGASLSHSSPDQQLSHQALQGFLPSPSPSPCPSPHHTRPDTVAQEGKFYGDARREEQPKLQRGLFLAVCSSN